MIILYQYTPKWGIPSPSPFCLKLETFLRMSNIPFDNKYVNDPRKAPKGKLPYIIDDGKKIADTNLIIEHLQQKFPQHIDRSLSKNELATSIAVTRLLEDHLYWVLLYARWGDNNSWNFIKKEFFKNMPIPLKWFLPEYFRKGILKQLHASGLGRHTAEEIYDFGKQDIDAIGALLSDQEYFWGGERDATSIDATLFRFLCNIVYAPTANPLQRHIERYPHIQVYCDRILQRYYPK